MRRRRFAPHRGRTALSARALVLTLALAMGAALLAQPAVAAPGDLTIAIAPTSAVGVLGGSSVLTGTLTNTSAADSEPLTVRASSELTVTAVSANGATCGIGFNDGQCNLPVLPAGSSVTVSVTVALDRIGRSSVVLVADACFGCEQVTATALLDVAPPPSSLSLRADTLRVDAGRTVTLTATAVIAMASSRVPQPSAFGQVAFSRQRPRDAAPVLLGTVSTNGTGVATFTDQPTERATYTAVFTAAGAQQSTSPPVTVEVGFGVTALVSPTVVPPGSPLTLTATVLPAVVGATVVVDQRVGAGPWRAAGTVRLSAKGAVRLALTASGPRGTLGVHTYRVRVAADATRLAGLVQTTTKITVTGRGNPRAWAPLAGSRTRPVRWNPCRPITWFLNPAHVPATGLADVRESLRRISLVSGLTFRYGGTTNRRVTSFGSGPGPGKVLVAWASPRESPLLGGYAAGVGSFASSGGRIITGQVVINREWSARAPAGFGSGVPQGAVLMHEFVHVVGLDHVDDPWSLMQAVGGALPASVWSAGDINGLRQVGRTKGCLR